MSSEAAARIASLNRSGGGVPKLPLERVQVSEQGMAGDRQRDLEHHGGPDRALSLWALERIEALAAEGHPMHPGAAGENVTVVGLDWSEVVPGVRLTLGDVEVEVTGYAAPCRTIMHCFADRRFSRISQKVHPGWSRVYARVLRGGELRVGDRVSRNPGVMRPLLAE